MFFQYSDLDNLIPYGYARKSTQGDEKQVESIPRQKDYIFSNFNGSSAPAKYHYYEERCSARKANVREEFYNLIEHLRTTTQKLNKRAYIKTIELTRLARNGTDGGIIIDLMFQEKLLACIVTPYRIFTDRDDPMSIYSVFAQAQGEIITLGRRSQAGMLNKAKKGWYPSPSLPTGYKFNLGYKAREEDPIIPDEPLFTQLCELNEEMLSGKFSLSQISHLAQQRGIVNPKTGKPLSTSFYSDFFRSEFYHGIFTWAQERYPNGKHQKLRTKEEFEYIQEILKQRSRKTRPKKYTYPYNGLIKCHCGRGMSTDHKRQVICTGCKQNGIHTKFSTKTKSNCPVCGLDEKDMKNPSIVDRCYLRCNNKKKCPGSSLSIPKFEQQVVAKFKSIQIRRGFADELRKTILQEQKNMEIEEARIRQQFEEEKQKVLAIRESLIEMKSEMEPEEFQTQWEKTETRRKTVNTGIDTVKKQSLDWQSKLLLYLDFAEHATEAFLHGDKEVRKEILLAIGSDIIIANKEVQFTLPKALYILQEYEEQMEGRSNRLEPRNGVEESGEFDHNKRLSQHQPTRRLEPKNPQKSPYFSGKSQIEELQNMSSCSQLALVRKARTALLENFRSKFLQKDAEEYGFLKKKRKKKAA